MNSTTKNLENYTMIKDLENVWSGARAASVTPQYTAERLEAVGRMAAEEDCQEHDWLEQRRGSRHELARGTGGAFLDGYLAGLRGKLESYEPATRYRARALLTELGALDNA